MFAAFFFREIQLKKKEKEKKKQHLQPLDSSGFDWTHPNGLRVGSVESATKAWSTHEWRPCCEHVIVLLVPCYCSVCAIVLSVKQQHRDLSRDPKAAELE